MSFLLNAKDQRRQKSSERCGNSRSIRSCALREFALLLSRTGAVNRDLALQRSRRLLHRIDECPRRKTHAAAQRFSRASPTFGCRRKRREFKDGRDRFTHSGTPKMTIPLHVYCPSSCTISFSGPPCPVKQLPIRFDATGKTRRPFLMAGDIPPTTLASDHLRGCTVNTTSLEPVLPAASRTFNTST